MAPPGRKVLCSLSSDFKTSQSVGSVSFKRLKSKVEKKGPLVRNETSTGYRHCYCCANG